MKIYNPTNKERYIYICEPMNADDDYGLMTVIAFNIRHARALIRREGNSDGFARPGAPGNFRHIALDVRRIGVADLCAENGKCGVFQ